MFLFLRESHKMSYSIPSFQPPLRSISAHKIFTGAVPQHRFIPANAKRQDCEVTHYWVKSLCVQCSVNDMTWNRNLQLLSVGQYLEEYWVVGRSWMHSERGGHIIGDASPHSSSSSYLSPSSSSSLRLLVEVDNRVGPPGHVSLPAVTALLHFPSIFSHHEREQALGTHTKLGYYKWVKPKAL